MQSNEYDYFIDLSSDRFAIFETMYIKFMPEMWYKEIISHDIVDFMLKLDDPDCYMEAFWEEKREVRNTRFGELINERHTWVELAGLKLPPITPISTAHKIGTRR